MPRWDPDARERLVAAAVQLFAEHGYDNVTVAQIAERAGLARSSFFRHFPDKKDVLSAGQQTMTRLLVEGIAAAPADATPLAAVGEGLRRASTMMNPRSRELGPVLRDLIASSVELQERNTLKQAGLTAAMADALRERGAPDGVATLSAELGGLAFRAAYAAWVAAEDDQDLGELACAELGRLRATAARLA
ncbi:MAG TPA: helix-turn-helix domain-containing protein [Cellulomonas sp.]